jgi:MYXO-CTERM domain-containing protein
LFGFRSDPIAEGFPADEIVEAVIPVPAGASTVQLEFGYLNAGNHWWWAVDNIAVGDDFFEDFESVELGPNQQEGRLPENLRGDLTNVWTDQAPEGWAIDDSGVPGFDDETNDGVTEWAGWSFANKDWWVGVAGDQRRSEFVAGEGAVLIADPDEWDDQAHAPSEENGWYQTTIDTPAISLEGVTEGDEVTVEFDSSWRPEFDNNFRQSGRLVAEIFEWNSADGNVTEEFLAGSEEVAATYENGDKINDEDLTFPIPVPANATSVTLQFEMFDAGNDWWWAIDNIRLLSGGEAVCSVMGDVDGDCAVQFSDFLILSENFGNMVPAGTMGDLNGDGDVAFADFLILSENFGTSAATPASVPEPTGFVIGMLGLLGLTVRRRRR